MPPTRGKVLLESLNQPGGGDLWGRYIPAGASEAIRCYAVHPPALRLQRQRQDSLRRRVHRKAPMMSGVRSSARWCAGLGAAGAHLCLGWAGCTAMGRCWSNCFVEGPYKPVARLKGPRIRLATLPLRPYVPEAWELRTPTELLTVAFGRLPTLGPCVQNSQTHARGVLRCPRLLRADAALLQVLVLVKVDASLTGPIPLSQANQGGP